MKRKAKKQKEKEAKLIDKGHEAFFGTDEEGVVFANMKELWEKELKGDKDKNWY